MPTIARRAVAAIRRYGGALLADPVGTGKTYVALAVAAALNADDRIEAYVVESENFESIHNHSAYALIKRDKTQE